MAKPPGFQARHTILPAQLSISREDLSDVGGAGLLNQYELTKLLAASVPWSDWEIQEVNWQQSSLSHHTALDVARTIRAADAAPESGASSSRDRPEVVHAEDEDFSFFDAGFLMADVKKPSRPPCEVDEDSEFEGLSDGGGSVDADGAEHALEEVPKVAAKPAAKAKGVTKTKATDQALIEEALGDRQLVRIRVIGFQCGQHQIFVQLTGGRFPLGTESTSTSPTARTLCLGTGSRSEGQRVTLLWKGLTRVPPPEMECRVSCTHIPHMQVRSE